MVLEFRIHPSGCSSCPDPSGAAQHTFGASCSPAVLMAGQCRCSRGAAAEVAEEEEEDGSVKLTESTR